MAEKTKDLSDEKIAKRRDAVLRRMLKSPPKPHAEMTGKRKKKPKPKKRKSE